MLPEVGIFEASDGFAALAIVENSSIDLIILDLIMPGKSGYELMNELRAAASHRNIPIIVYSAVSDEATIKSVLDKGVYDYFVKPLNAEHLRSLLPEKIMTALKLREADRQTRESEHAALSGKFPEYKAMLEQISELEKTISHLDEMTKEELLLILTDLLQAKRREECGKLETWKKQKLIELGLN